MEEKYFYEVFENIPRQGPGLNKSTRRAFDIVKGYTPEYPKILDIGCGKGVQTVKIAHLTTGSVIAIDNHPPFIEGLNRKLEDELLTDTAKAKVGDMFNLDFRNGQFDIIWSEGSIYIIGFDRGIKEWGQYLKAGGHMVISDAVYLKNEIPDELSEFWNKEYPDISNVDHKLEIIENNDYRIIKHFTLPPEGWKKEYYDPMQEQINQLKEKNKGVKEAEAVYSSLEKEIGIFNKFGDYYGYEFFIIRKK